MLLDRSSPATAITCYLSLKLRSEPDLHDVTPMSRVARMVAFEDVPNELRMSYFVGEIVIRDSYAEHEARVLWNVLRAHQVVDSDYPREFGRLLKHMRRALLNEAVPEDIRQIALGVVEQATRWHRYRSALVHDLLSTGWRQDDGDVHSRLNKNPPRPLRDLEQCADGLRLATYRFRGLWIVMPFWLGAEGDGWESADDLRSWTRVAMGHIADELHVMKGTPGSAPEPRGGWDEIVAAAVAAEERRAARRSAMFWTDNLGD